MFCKEEVAKIAIKLQSNQTFKPTVSPSCADFVSYVLEQAGWKGEHITYVPYFFDYFKVNNTGKRGDVVIFKETYDANDDGVINYKDDKTHVGIMISDSVFIHFSASAGKVTSGTLLEPYWQKLVECFLDIPETTNDIKKHWAYGSYMNLVSKKILTDNKQEDLNRSMTKGEICAMTDKLISYLEQSNKIDPTKDFTFNAKITILGDK